MINDTTTMFNFADDYNIIVYSFLFFILRWKTHTHKHIKNSPHVIVASTTQSLFFFSQIIPVFLKNNKLCDTDTLVFIWAYVMWLAYFML